MQIIQFFNETINYIESVLDSEIDEDKITHLSTYSYPIFSRLFSILTDTTLSEYIRSRRLTEAAVLLRDTNIKVIDIAMKYGYESSDSFGTAFKKISWIYTFRSKKWKTIQNSFTSAASTKCKRRKKYEHHNSKEKFIYSCR